jgi:hypothetical protein
VEELDQLSSADFESGLNPELGESRRQK